MNPTGLLSGLVLLLAIGFGHLWVVRLEYHFGARIWRGVLLIGLLFVFLSSIAPSFNLSAVLGIIAGSIIWGATELPEQAERVRQGIFPSNPDRAARESRNDD